MSHSKHRLSKILQHIESTPSTSHINSIGNKKKIIYRKYNTDLPSKVPSLKGKTIFITGGSRGIGLAIALKCARDNCNIVMAAKTATIHPKLPGTIYTAAKQIEDLGSNALPIICDIRNEEAVKRAIEKCINRFGNRIDILINNAGMA
eukprot:99785_1